MQEQPSANTAELKGHPWFAATYDHVMRWSEQRILSQLRPFIAGQATGRILEIGAGTGANFQYYKAAEKIVATEPDPYMLRQARKRAEELGLDIEFHQCAAEALPFGDSCFDTVVATLVLCTVRDQFRSLSEVRRVLKPGGTFRFLEHVRADRIFTGRVQDVLTPLWSCVGAGCHLNRRTGASIEAAGFTIAEMRHHRMPLGIPLIAGVARPTSDRPNPRAVQQDN
ncbi:MAG: class I SAM-dependent methyltransferase [Chloroflexota bacterium]|nr:class I SAM-dependent methyltransferase [Chloroflexota bacterium]